MKAKNQFTMQLANGKEQTFESAAEWLPGWIVSAGSVFQENVVDARNQNAIASRQSWQRRTVLKKPQHLWHGTRTGTAAKLKPS